ncbi:hypothetical protein EDD21DRAFT_79963 [Dissophora ornata]|nr:hypothetical protein BGZ58_001650 [Dissophora ornata]KAI8602345.1 hypothetical protein EDD21DRAFT_79963 [Dissophora ornata]
MDFEKATLKKAAVSTLPIWAEPEQSQQYTATLDGLPEEGLYNGPEYPSPKQGVASPSAPLANSSASTSGSSTVKQSNTSNHHPQSSISASSITSNGNADNSPPTTQKRSSLPFSYSTASSSYQQDWSVFATMSSVSTISDIPRKYQGTLGPGGSMNSEPKGSSSTAVGPSAVTLPSSKKAIGARLNDMFKTGHMDTNAGKGPDSNSICTCNCPQHGRGELGYQPATSTSKRWNRKEMQEMRGYPTGQCDSTEPPEHTNWDEKDAELPLTQGMAKNTATNTAFNLGAMKAFLNSPLFSNFLKTLTVMASVSLFAIALDAIIILVKTPDQQTQLSDDNVALVFTVVLSLLTIAYSCFTIFLESRRPPEGLDTSNSKPLIVIFSEIIASVVWAQVLSITIYIYIWTYGCTEAGQRQLDRTWKEGLADQNLTEKLCRRQGAMVGLELLLVLLLVFNFYTHLAQNFKFIRAVS